MNVCRRIYVYIYACVFDDFLLKARQFFFLFLPTGDTVEQGYEKTILALAE